MAGWGWPGLAKKAHYFEDDYALCGKWLFTGATVDSNHDSPDNCATCRRKLQPKLDQAEKAARQPGLDL
jgi:hypothetical protein